jgi:hypothetical protein
MGVDFDCTKIVMDLNLREEITETKSVADLVWMYQKRDSEKMKTKRK